jgi:hypothetical protein
MQYMGCPILVGMPLSADYKADLRVFSVLEKWDRTELAETYYAPTPFPTLGRDRIVSHAMYRIPRPTHIFFIDSDVLPRANTLEKLLDLDKDIAVGVYPTTSKKGLSWSVAKEELFLRIDDLPRSPFKVKYTGFGCVLVKMEVFEKLQWPYWKNEFVEGGIEKGEDIYFCDKVREAGFDIWCEPKVKCNHIRITSLMNIVNNKE